MVAVVVGFREVGTAGDRAAPHNFGRVELVSVQVHRATGRDFKRAERAPVAVRRERAVAHHAPARCKSVSGRRLNRDLARRIAAKVDDRRGRGKSVLDFAAARVHASPVIGIRGIAVVAIAGPPRELRNVARLAVEKPRGGQHRLDAGLRRLRTERERDAGGHLAPRHQARAARKGCRAVAHVDRHRGARGELERPVAVPGIGDGRQRTRPRREVNRRAVLHRRAVVVVVRGRFERAVNLQRSRAGAVVTCVQSYVIAHRNGHLDVQSSSDPERYVRRNDTGFVDVQRPRAGYVEGAVVHDRVVEPEALARGDVQRQRMSAKFQLALPVAIADKPDTVPDLEPGAFGGDDNRIDLRGAAGQVRTGVPNRSAVEGDLVVEEVTHAVEVERRARRDRYPARVGRRTQHEVVVAVGHVGATRRLVDHQSVCTRLVYLHGSAIPPEVVVSGRNRGDAVGDRLVAAAVELDQIDFHVIAGSS